MVSVHASASCSVPADSDFDGRFFVTGSIHRTLALYGGPTLAVLDAIEQRDTDRQENRPAHWAALLELHAAKPADGPQTTAGR